MRAPGYIYTRQPEPLIYIKTPSLLHPHIPAPAPSNVTQLPPMPPAARRTADTAHSRRLVRRRTRRTGRTLVLFGLFGARRVLARRRCGVGAVVGRLGRWCEVRWDADSARRVADGRGAAVVALPGGKCCGCRGWLWFFEVVWKWFIGILCKWFDKLVWKWVVGLFSGKCVFWSISR